MFGMQRWIGITAILAVTLSCVEETKPDANTGDNFDRRAMLGFWADEIIIPAYQDYNTELSQLEAVYLDFKQSPNAQTLNNLRAQFGQVYLAWQSASLFEIGPAETRSLLNHSNIYPCDTGEILAAIQSGTYNLTLPSTFDSQGLPALDFILFFKTGGDAIDFLKESDTQAYVESLIARLLLLHSETLQAWQTSYRNTFVDNDGSSANASVNKMANDFIFHFEKELRAGKVGIPAGVFSGNKLPNRVEAYYQAQLSKALFLESLAAHQRFFEGLGHDSTTAGPSLKAYLDYLNIESNGLLLSDRILNQFEEARQKAQILDNNFAYAAEHNTADLLALFDALQQNVVWIKVDLMQALNIRIDYVDADGD